MHATSTTVRRRHWHSNQFVAKHNSTLITHCIVNRTLQQDSAIARALRGKWLSRRILQSDISHCNATGLRKQADTCRQHQHARHCYILARRRRLTNCHIYWFTEARFPQPELTGDRFPLPVNTGRVSNIAPPILHHRYSPT